MVHELVTPSDSCEDSCVIFEEKLSSPLSPFLLQYAVLGYCYLLLGVAKHSLPCSIICLMSATLFSLFYYTNHQADST
jgi:hypothetical protein